ncbi:nifR3 family TIM-barrel protein [Kineococcus radiotolerans]|uniref:tRNA-dihydrouridine synthase n=2 Tax=Kineococcus radiotolerans TaxID=131568 RepID=A6WDE0_KINRD|nr:tRNA dihydrouridine synthase DusB [Kineococcus radiotolerans]ABS04829.1 putative TIM-barrel protein, nifR3 family [Kineococcus radiotolerans SRS30216 = ATCC BAA-149]MBB2901672.1 nifR3 family TIM-barrel protein [Kineococcus radiotolerans]
MSAPTLTAVQPLRIGPHVSPTPVVLAPMAGITNTAYRQLCREHGEGFYVSEMVTSRALVERHAETMRLVTFTASERPRSLQLYGVDPTTVAAAVRMVVEDDLADHVDLNFGCPVPKVTRKGGGSALPWKAELFRSIVRGAVAEASRGGIPLTVKMRKGIDDDHLTYLQAGKAAEQEGAAAVALHGRTASQHYSGQADWEAIARLKETVTTIPVLGNGDVWSAEDALEMVRRTGCDGVVVGRGCLGRPWLFADLEAGFAGREDRVKPGLRQVAQVLRRHAELLVEFYGDELRGCRDIRKHVSWYLKGYPVGGDVRARLGLVDTLEALDELLDSLDLDLPYPGAAAEGSRGRAGSPQARVALPEGWLDDQELTGPAAEMIRQAELSVSGG